MGTEMNGHSVNILMVEDNAGDVRLAREIFKEGKISTSLHAVRDGEEAMSFLRRECKFGEAARPDLILLDFNLSRKDGREVLMDVKGDADLRRIPVIVLTSSRAEGDIQRAYNLNANCYIAKPLDLDQYARIIRAIEDFWLTVAHLPRY